MVHATNHFPKVMAALNRTLEALYAPGALTHEEFQKVLDDGRELLEEADFIEVDL